MKKLNFLLCMLLVLGLVGCSSNSPQEDELMEDANAIEMAQDDSDALEIAEDDLMNEEQAAVAQEEAMPQEEMVQEQPREEIAVTTDVEYYEVQPGDTLMLIAFKIYGDYLKWRSIAAMNQEQIGANGQIEKGMRIKYARPASRFDWNPQGNPYLIVRGDTLGKISGKVYNTPAHWKDIWNNNRPMIKDPSLIFAGFTLYYLPLRDLASR